MNPDRLRDHYGKLLFLLQDSRIPEIAELFGFDPVIPIRTVYTLLESRGERALALLDDPLVPYATRTIIAENKHRHQIDREIKQKERAIEELVRVSILCAFFGALTQLFIKQFRIPMKPCYINCSLMLKSNSIILTYFYYRNTLSDRKRRFLSVVTGTATSPMAMKVMRTMEINLSDQMY